MALRRTEFQENLKDLTLAGAGFLATQRDANDLSARENENTILMGQSSGSIESQHLRGQEAAKDEDELRRREKEKARARMEDRLLRDLLRKIDDMERAIADKYGENFAMDLIAHLHEQGKISNEDYDYIASMQDLGQQRHAAALVVQKGLDQGTLSREDLNDFEWATDEWLDNHTHASKLRDDQAEKLLRSELGVDKASVSATYEADEKSKNVQAFEKAAMEKEGSAHDLVQEGEQLTANFNIDDLSFTG